MIMVCVISLQSLHMVWTYFSLNLFYFYFSFSSAQTLWHEGEACHVSCLIDEVLDDIIFDIIST